MLKEISQEELKSICTQILKKFDSICKDNNLKYSIAYGTLIGAVRHKGFIPWDDDIDVIMPRADYERLLDLKYDDGDYEIKDYRHTKGYYYVFAKMIDKHTYLKEYNRREKDMGIYIDIFPIDFTENNKVIIENKVRKTTKYKKIADQLGHTVTKETSSNILSYRLKKIIKGLLLPFRKQILGYIDNKFINDKR